MNQQQHLRPIRPKFAPRFEQIEREIAVYEEQHERLVGIQDPVARAVLINQLIDSERRNAYFDHLRARELSENSVDPHHADFDPLKASLIHYRQGNIDEAFWLVYLFVYFGKHAKSGWTYLREIYGKAGSSPNWTWTEIVADTFGFRLWLQENYESLVSSPKRGGFGNHRKYSTLKPDSSRGAPASFRSYVDLVHTAGGHQRFFEQHKSNHREESFDSLYSALTPVIDFGRVARFDYLMTVKRLGFADIEPGHPYLVGATGPLSGARLLFDGPSSSGSPKRLEESCREFSRITGLSSDVLEDAICNWQKSPIVFRKFVL